MSASDRLTLGLLLVSACASPSPPSEAPDVTQLLSAYAAPGGTIDSAHPASWVDAGAAQLDVLGGGQADVVIAQVAASALRGVDRAELPNGRDDLVPTRVDGVATLQVSCGLASHETADVAVAIVDGAVSRLLWGTSHACPIWQVGGARESYDGSFTMYRYSRTELLVRVDGMLASARTPISMDFRLSGGRLETRVATPSGDLIVSRRGADLVARAANGTFRCNAKRRACVRSH